MQLFRNDPSDDHLGGAPKNPPPWRCLGCRALWAGAVLALIVALAITLYLTRH